MDHLPEVRIVSKPVVPPWDDSGKNIIRTQLQHGQRYRYRVPITAGAAPPTANAIGEEVFGKSTAYAPRSLEKLRILSRGLRPGSAALYHYFFAPNPASSLAGRAQIAVARAPSLQTVCSTPASTSHLRRLIFTDLVIALSQHTCDQLIRAGVPARRVRLVRPGIVESRRQDASARERALRQAGLPNRRLVLYPGDLEFSSAAQTVADAVEAICARAPDTTVVFACRAKTQRAHSERQRLENQLRDAVDDSRAVFLGAVEDMPALAGAADVVVLPAESLYAKMDAPLVLLEAMAQEVPLVLADTPPLDELLDAGGGIGIPPRDPAALADAVCDLLCDEDRRRELGRAGRAATRGPFAASTMAKQVEQVYDELLHRG